MLDHCYVVLIKPLNIYYRFKAKYTFAFKISLLPYKWRRKFLQNVGDYSPQYEMS
jgi:hypothetical protein